jgi:hypothetical protein
LGAPNTEGRAWLQRAFNAYEHLFAAPTPQAIPAHTIDPTGEEHTLPPHPDSSLTNPRRALLGLQLGAIVANPTRLEQFAARAESQLGPTLTPPQGERALALAVAALALHKDAVAMFHVAGAREPPPVALQADAIRAIINTSPEAIQRALTALIEEHARSARQHDSARDPMRAFSLPALAFAAFARARGLATPTPASCPSLALLEGE